MDVCLFLALVLSCTSVVGADSTNEFTNEIKEGADDIQQLKITLPNTVEMSALKPFQRPVIGHRTKRTVNTRAEKSVEFKTKELSRQKRFRGHETNILTRVKRLKRHIRHTSPDFSHFKHIGPSMTFTFPERLSGRNDGHLKRLKRAIVASAAQLVQNKRSKRIPPDVHKNKRVKDKTGIHKMLRALDKRQMTKSKGHFRRLHGEPYNSEKNYSRLNQMRASDNMKHRQHRFRDIGTFRQRMQKRLRDKKNKYQLKRKWHKKMKMKKDKHHVQSHRLNKKDI